MLNDEAQLEQHRRIITIEYPDSTDSQRDDELAKGRNTELKDLTKTSRNSIAMKESIRESLDFQYSESNMLQSSQQKTRGVQDDCSGTINQTPSSIDFKLTTKEECSATPKSHGVSLAPTNDN